MWRAENEAENCISKIHGNRQKAEKKVKTTPKYATHEGWAYILNQGIGTNAQTGPFRPCVPHKYRPAKFWIRCVVATSVHLEVCSVAMVSKQSKSPSFIWPGSGLYKALPSQASTVVQVESSMPRDIARGIASVKRFVRQHNIKGVHGTLIELIECSNRLHTAIEVQALAANLCLQCSGRKTSPVLVLCPCTQLPLSWGAANPQTRHESSTVTRCMHICILGPAGL